MDRETVERSSDIVQNGELVKVTQLPIIEEQLRAVKEWVEKELALVEGMDVSEETIISAKSYRSDLNHLFAELETRRKEVKFQIEATYKQFEAVYKECISDNFKRADGILRAKIADVENSMKSACESRLRDFFAELVQANNLDFLTYEQTGIVVSMADAKAKTQPPKRLREYLEQFVQRVAQDVDMIATLEDRDEIMVHYKQTLNATQAIASVKERHRLIEEAKADQERREAAKAQETETVRKIEAFTAPSVVSAPHTEQEQHLTVSFTVTDTRERLKLLKRFLEANNYNYR